MESTRSPRVPLVITLIGRWACRFPVEILGDEGVQDQQNDARNEEEECEWTNIVEFRPVVVPSRPARRFMSQIFGIDAVLRQPNDRTKLIRVSEKK